MLSDRECETAGTSKDMKVLIFLSYRLLTYLFLFSFFLLVSVSFSVRCSFHIQSHFLLSSRRQ